MSLAFCCSVVSLLYIEYYEYDSYQTYDLHFNFFLNELPFYFIDGIL